MFAAVRVRMIRVCLGASASPIITSTELCFLIFCEMNDGIIFISSVLVTTGVSLITTIKGFDLLMTETSPAALAMEGIEEQRLEDKRRYFFLS